MPTYEYLCPRCELIQDVIKPISMLEETEMCMECEEIPMIRQMTAIRLNTSNCQYEAHYNHGLGKVLKGPNDVKEELSRIKGETGKEIVEVGNDRLDSVKFKRKEYTLD